MVTHLSILFLSPCVRLVGGGCPAPTLFSFFPSLNKRALVSGRCGHYMLASSSRFLVILVALISFSSSAFIWEKWEIKGIDFLLNSFSEVKQ